MKAFIHHGAQGLAGTSYTEMEERQPGRGEVKVRLKTAGLNHRDCLFPIVESRKILLSFSVQMERE